MTSAETKLDNYGMNGLFRTPRMDSGEHIPADRRQSTIEVAVDDEIPSITRNQRSHSVSTFHKKKGVKNDSTNDIEDSQEVVTKRRMSLNFMKKLKKDKTKSKEDLKNAETSEVPQKLSITKRLSKKLSRDTENNLSTEVKHEPSRTKNSISSRLKKKKSKDEVVALDTISIDSDTQEADNNSQNDISDVEGEPQTVVKKKENKRPKGNSQSRPNEVKEFSLESNNSESLFMSDKRRIFLKKPEQEVSVRTYSAGDSNSLFTGGGKSCTPVLNFDEVIVSKSKKKDRSQKSSHNSNDKVSSGRSSSAKSTSKHTNWITRRLNKKKGSSSGIGGNGTGDDSADTDQDDRLSATSSAGLSRLSVNETTGGEYDDESTPEMLMEETTTSQSPNKTSKNPKLSSVNDNAERFTMLSDDSDNNDQTSFSPKKKQKQFLEEKKSKSKSMSGKPLIKGSSTGKITQLTRMGAFNSDEESEQIDIVCEFPKTPWEPVKYDPLFHGDEIDDSNHLTVNQMVNMLADPDRMSSTVLIDTRSYEDYITGHLVCAKHLSDYQDVDCNLDLDMLKEEFSSVILYDQDGKSSSLLTSELSKCYDTLKQSKMNVYIVDDGLIGVTGKLPTLLDKKVKESCSIPTILEDGKLFLCSTFNCKILDIVHRFKINRVITYNESLIPEFKKEYMLEYYLMKPDSLFSKFEEIIKFMVKGNRIDSPSNSKILVCCDDAENNSASIALGYIMFNHHWSVSDAHLYLTSQRTSIKLAKENLKSLIKIERKFYNRIVTKSLVKPKQKSKKAELEDASSSLDENEKSGSRLKRLKLKKRKSQKATVDDGSSDDEKNYQERDEKISEIRERRQNRRMQQKTETVEDCDSEETHEDNRREAARLRRQKRRQRKINSSDEEET